MSTIIEEIKDSDILLKLTDEEKKKLRRQRFIFDSGNTIETIKVKKFFKGSCLKKKNKKSRKDKKDSE